MTWPEAMGTVGGKVGCGAALVAGLLAFGPLLFMSFYGDCGGEASCTEGDGVCFLMVAGIVAAVAAAAGFATRFAVNKLAGPEK
jgi:hypothetical protein